MFKIWIAKLFGVSCSMIDKKSPVLYWIVFTSLRMCLQTCLFAALSWPTVCLLEPYRRCWPTASIQLQRWDTFFIQCNGFHNTHTCCGILGFVGIPLDLCVCSGKAVLPVCFVLRHPSTPSCCIFGAEHGSPPPDSWSLETVRFRCK